MEKPETLADFYQDKLASVPPAVSQDDGHFNVFNFDDCLDTATIPYARRHFFKIALLRGHHLLHFGHQSLEVNGTALLFFNPDVPYTFENRHRPNQGLLLHFSGRVFQRALPPRRARPAHVRAGLQARLPAHAHPGRGRGRAFPADAAGAAF